MNRRGQALVLLALTMILVVVMACVTVSIAVRTRERLEQQTLADTIAYSNAVASARTYNTLSLINRSAIAHWVSLMAVQANVAWATLHHAWFEGLADAVGTLNGVCAAGNQELRDARHSLVHAGLSSYNRQGAYAADDVHLGRGHPSPCTLMNERSWNPRVRNFGEEDLNVANQSRVIYDAILDLNDIQLDVWDELDRRVKGEEIARSLVKLSRGDNTMGPYRMLDGSSTGDGPAWDAVSHAVGRGPTDGPGDRADSLVPLAHAAMGSRPSGFLLGGTDENPAGTATPRSTNRAQPPWTLSVMDDIEADLNNHYGPDSFHFKVDHFAVRSFLAKNSPDRFPGLSRVHAGRQLGFANVAGNAWVRLKIEYRDPCAGGATRVRWVWAVADMMLNRMDTSVHAWGYGITPDGLTPPGGYNNGHAGVGEGLTGAHNARYGDDSHAGHRHWRENQERDHYLQGVRNASIWPRGFGYVFPQSRAQERNFPVYGQPRMPVFLARSYRPGDVAPDPWNLTVGMNFTAAGSLFDMTAGRVAPDQAAISTAILYYHRRRANGAGAGDRDRIPNNGWVESPNLLNPYWHATLVRSDLGDRRTPTARRVLPVFQRDEYNMLRDEGFTKAAAAYRALENAGFKSWQ